MMEEHDRLISVEEASRASLQADECNSVSSFSVLHPFQDLRQGAGAGTLVAMIGFPTSSTCCLLWSTWLKAKRKKLEEKSSPSSPEWSYHSSSPPLNVKTLKFEGEPSSCSIS